MKISPTHRLEERFCGSWVRVTVTTLCMVAGSAALMGARAEPADSRPQLLSTTGGGGGGGPWSSIKELETAAAKGNPRAWADLGELKLKGEHTPKDVPGGLELLEKAARAGQAAAAFSLGKAYNEGTGVTMDRAKALDYFRAAAAGHIPEAFYNLGASYASGRGTKRDYAEGLAWMILAGKAGLESNGESVLRERLVKMRRKDLVEKAAKRVPAIEAELAGRSVASFLPDAPAEMASPAPTPSPTRPRERLAPPPSATGNTISEVTVDLGAPAGPVRMMAPPPPPVPVR